MPSTCYFSVKHVTLCIKNVAEHITQLKKNCQTCYFISKYVTLCPKVVTLI